MKKKFATIGLLVLILVLCFSLTACSEQPFDKELLSNGSFNEENTLAGWTRDSSSSVKYTYSQEDDNKYISIENKNGVTSNLYQKIAVEKGATYKVAVKVKISSSISSNRGFSVGFMENTDIKTVAKAETNGWENYEIYFKPDMDGVTISLKLAGTGTVSIDEVSVMKVSADKVPAGATVYDVKTVVKLPYQKTAGGITLSVFMILLSVILVVGGYFALRRIATSDNFLPAVDTDKIEIGKLKMSPLAIVSSLLAVGFVVRFIMALTVYGYDPIYNNEATIMATLGLPGFYYVNESITPPGYLYYLALFGLMKQGANITGAMGVSIMLKLPSILADMGIIYLLYSYGRKYVGDKNAAVFSLLYAVFPAVFMLNAGWGGLESLALLGIISIFICILEKKHIGLLFSTLYSVLFSFEAVYVLPLVLTYLVVRCVKEKDVKFILKSVLGVVLFFVGFYLLTLPFTIGFVKAGFPMQIFVRYYDVLAADAVACFNTFNLFAILGLNNQTASQATFIVSIIFVALVWAFSIYSYVAKRNRLNLLLAGAFTYVSVGAFAVNQTKAMAVIGAGLLLLYAMLSRDKRIYWISGGVVSLNAMNIFSLYDMAGYFGSNPNRYELYAKFDWVQVLGSVLMVILVIVLMFITYDICTQGRRKEIQPLYQAEIDETKKKIAKKLNLKKAKSR